MGYVQDDIIERVLGIIGQLESRTPPQDYRMKRMFAIEVMPFIDDEGVIKCIRYDAKGSLLPEPSNGESFSVSIIGASPKKSILGKEESGNREDGIRVAFGKYFAKTKISNDGLSLVITY